MPARLIDSHCHLDMEAFDGERPQVVERARAVGVVAMLTIGAGGALECNRKAIALAEKFPEVYAAVGIHPHDAKLATPDALDAVRAWAAHPKVVAIGEAGLDFRYDRSARPVQEAAFRAFIGLAKECRLPLVVHLREAHDAAVRILREEKASEVGGVVHCFSGDASAARDFLDLGFYLSFSGTLTFKNAASVREAARVVPEDRLLVETDAPFLAPAPLRGRRNEPAFVIHTAAYLAALRGLDLHTLGARTCANARALFGFPDLP